MLMSVTVSQARPQSAQDVDNNVEFVTTVENIVLDDSLEATTDNTVPEVSDLGGEWLYGESM